MKVVLAFDSFKETMSSLEVALITKEELLKKYPDLNVDIISVADGGEGSLDSIAYSTHSIKEEYEVTGPHFEKIKASVLNVNGDYYIESASVVGFKYKKIEDTPKMITTYGIGELIKKVLTKNPKSINICLGGTISNDGGCGMASALGVKFLDSEGKEFVPIGKSLKRINAIDISGIDPRVLNVEINALSDVNNPLYGLNGASYVFAKQKGADDNEIKFLDNSLKYLNEKVEKVLQQDFSKFPGSGAAGGLGFACYAFLKAKQKSGIDKILEACGFDEKIIDADYIFTGEGKLDNQSFQGKVIVGILEKAKKYQKKVIGIFGIIDKDVKDIPNTFENIYQTNFRNLPFSEAKKTCIQDLKKIVNEIVFI